MAPSKQEDKRLKEAVREILPEVFREFEQRRELALVERIVRVEEGLRAVQERIEQILVQMDKRFEQVDKRFEQVDKRFEQVDKRFEQVDRRFEDLQRYIDKRFSMLQWFMGIGFTGISVLMALFNYI